MSRPCAPLPLSAMARRCCVAASMGMACLGATVAHPGEEPAKADPRSAQSAWTALLGITDAALPRGTGCHGDYGELGHGRRPRVKDLLGSQLAYMSAGQNTLSGHCAANRCEVQLQRRNGEDVSSATLTFDLLRDGRADPRSLRCVMTP
jgi:hypothetical protein